MSVSTDEFRRAIGSLAGGVVIVTTSTEDGTASGMTATAVCSVSLEPPLVMACMSHAAATYRAVQASGVFALNVLPAGAEGLARRFAATGPDKFEGLRSTVGVTGAPVLDGVLAHCDCEVERTVAAGDHTIFIGRVVEVSCSEAELSPLLYFRGGYGSIGPLVVDPIANEREAEDEEADGPQSGPGAWPNLP